MYRPSGRQYRRGIGEFLRFYGIRLWKVAKIRPGDSFPALCVSCAWIFMSILERGCVFDTLACVFDTFRYVLDALCSVLATERSV
jgi:hypothetical protein